jgi:hypothetical protein
MFKIIFFILVYTTLLYLTSLIFKLILVLYNDGLSAIYTPKELLSEVLDFQENFQVTEIVKPMIFTALLFSFIIVPLLFLTSFITELVF